MLPPSEVPEEQIKSDRQKTRLGKRKAISDLLNSTREELFSGEFDRWFLCHLFLALRWNFEKSLIISSEYDPYSIIERLSPYLGGSASIVVHSPSAQVGLQSKYSLHFLSIPPLDCSEPAGEIANNAPVSVSNGVRAMVTTVSGLFNSVPADVSFSIDLGSSWSYSPHDGHVWFWGIHFKCYQNVCSTAFNIPFLESKSCR